jgi:uncharacterized membrane protein
VCSLSFNNIFTIKTKCHKFCPPACKYKHAFRLNQSRSFESHSYSYFHCRTLQLFKTKAVGAKKGFELLKKKSDALKKAFRAILQKIIEAKVRMGSDFKEATIGLAGATFAAGDFSRGVLDHVKTRTQVRLNVSTENIAGVHLPIFSLRGEDEVDED